jgi:NNP family nitrate/nitrite transporter-like MFS transporter
MLAAKDSPGRSAPSSWSDYGAVLREPDTLWFSFLYSLTFGGFVGFTSFLTTFFYEQYHVSRVSAGDFATIVIVSGSLMRPVGGWLSDRLGGYRLLLLLLAGAGLSLGAVAMLPPLAVVVPLLFVTVGLLGMGNGAVFQLVPQRFAARMGIVTGIVGAAGGLGGFFLPSVLGAAKDATGTYAIGLMAFAAAFMAGSFVLLELGTRWKERWHLDAVKRSGIFSYRRVAATGRPLASQHSAVGSQQS